MSFSAAVRGRRGGSGSSKFVTVSGLRVPELSPSEGHRINGSSTAATCHASPGVSACFAWVDLPRISRNRSPKKPSTFLRDNGKGPGLVFVLRSPASRGSWLGRGGGAAVLGRLPFASLTTTVASQHMHQATDSEPRLRSKFDEISGRKRCFNEEDLQRYAANNGLPANYVGPFMSAVKKSGGWWFPSTPEQKCITYEKFSTYVLSREAALMQMFQTLDVSGRGSITAEELEIALSHVRVKCPESKCVYKCRREVVKGFVATVSGGKQSAFSFNDFRNFFLLLPSNDMLMDYYMSSRDSSPCDIGGRVVLRKKSADGNPMGHLVAGAMSGAVSRTVTAPLETVRLMAMTGSMPEGTGALSAARTVVQSSGWKGLFRGNGVNVMRSAPQKALDFFAFDGFKKLLSGSKQSQTGTQMGAGGTLLAAGLAGATSSTLLYPLEVVRSRLTVDKTATYKGVFDAFHKILKVEGTPALYAGLGPSIAAIIPEAAITYGMFDVLKKSYSQMRGVAEPPVVVSLAFGVSSAFMGQLVAYPLETVSRRMQVATDRRGVASVVQQILRAEGIGGLYGGVRASMLKVLPMAILSFGTYEFVRMHLNRLADAMEEEQVKNERKRCHLEGKQNCSASQR